MGNVMLDDILVTKMDRIELEGGDVLHGMKESDIGYIDYGEIYFSIIKEGYTKAWKRHIRMTMNLLVPIGSVQFVFVDEQGRQREEVIGDDRYCRITVPPGIWFGFSSIVRPYSLVVNIADIMHDKDEIERKAISSIYYPWNSIK